MGVKGWLIVGALLLVVSALAQKPVTLSAADGVKVYGDYYAATGAAKGTLLLFHLVDGNRGEYSEAIPLFVAAGYVHVKSRKT